MAVERECICPGTIVGPRRHCDGCMWEARDHVNYLLAELSRVGGWHGGEGQSNGCDCVVCDAARYIDRVLRDEQKR